MPQVSLLRPGFPHGEAPQHRQPSPTPSQPQTNPCLKVETWVSSHARFLRATVHSDSISTTQAPPWRSVDNSTTPTHPHPPLPPSHRILVHIQNLPAPLPFRKHIEVVIPRQPERPLHRLHRPRRPQANFSAFKAFAPPPAEAHSPADAYVPASPHIQPHKTHTEPASHRATVQTNPAQTHFADKASAPHN